MPGSITIRPIEANLTHNTEFLSKMSPYCAFVVGNNVFKSQICKKGGKHPHWGDAVTIPIQNEKQMVVEVVDKDKLTKDDHIGSFVVNLNELQKSGLSSRWYPLTYKDKPAGEILLETTMTGTGGSGYTQSGMTGSGLTQSGMSQTSTGTGPYLGGGTYQSPSTQRGYMTEQPQVIQQEIYRESIPHHERHSFTEQQQFIEPRTFTKEIDVVETRPHLENIEVLEPHRVLKDVEYTQAVPVTKQIEVSEPHVIRKEVEVIEPRLVTKEIQVIENVPVMKQVEVIENVPRMQNVQTFEQQTFHKQIEVTDYIPVQKQVTVSEPVHLKKSVEFVEPVITTKTITKEMMEPVIVDEKVTTFIGPASIIGERDTYITEHFSRYGFTRDEGLNRYDEWNRLRQSGYDDQRIDEHFRSQGWGPVSKYHFYDFHKGYHPHSSHHHRSQYGSGHFSNLGISQDEGLYRYNEWNRLRQSGYDDTRLDKHFATQGWGPVSQYRFDDFSKSYNPQGSTYQQSTLPSYSQQGNVQYGTQSQSQSQYDYPEHFSKLGISQDEGLDRYNEWNRLRQRGYSDQRLDEHFTNKGWGPVHSYQFAEFSNKYYPQSSQYQSQPQSQSQYGSGHFSKLGISHDEGLNRYNEWNRLRQSGYDDTRLDKHFATQGWGPVSQYRFDDFSKSYNPQGSTYQQSNLPSSSYSQQGNVQYGTQSPQSNLAYSTQSPQGNLGYGSQTQQSNMPLSTQSQNIDPLTGVQSQYIDPLMSSKTQQSNLPSDSQFKHTVPPQTSSRSRFNPFSSK